jgi:hypothetical protein
MQSCRSYSYGRIVVDGDSNLVEIVVIDILSVITLPPLMKESICVSAIFSPLSLSLYFPFLLVARIGFKL